MFVTGGSAAAPVIRGPRDSVGFPCPRFRGASASPLRYRNLAWAHAPRLMHIRSRRDRLALDAMKSFALAVAIAGLTLPAFASVVLDFEGPLPGGLVPTSYIQGASVPATARVTDQYLPIGIRIADAALVQLGVGHAASGANGLAGISANGTIDYDQAVTFSFYFPGDGSTAGTTDFFAYSPDRGGGSGNVITISAFGLDDALIGQAQFTESGTFASPLAITGIGQFHKVTVDQTLYDRASGGIGLDLVQFGDIVLAVPEPATLALVGVAMLGAATTRRRRLADT